MALLLLAAYVPRWVRVRRSADRAEAPVWRLCSWIAGALTLVVAQGNPIDKLGDYLLVMHMVQHLMLLDLMPLLLLFGLNRVIMRPITRRVQWLEQRVGFLAKPWFGLVAYTLGMWFWHVPTFYDAAARSETVHLLEHMTFTAVGFLYWWHLLRPIPTRERMTAMGPVAYMGITKITVGLLGALLTFAPSAIYGFYDNNQEWWGLSPVADQAMAGALMATEQVLIMGVAFGALFIRGLREAELRAQREERLMDRREAAEREGRIAPEPSEPPAADGLALRTGAPAEGE